MFNQLKEAVNAVSESFQDPIVIDDVTYGLLEATLDAPIFMHSLENDQFLEEAMDNILAEFGTSVHVYKPAQLTEEDKTEEDNEELDPEVEIKSGKGSSKEKPLKEEPEDESVLESFEDILGLNQLEESNKKEYDELYSIL